MAWILSASFVLGLMTGAEATLPEPEVVWDCSCGGEIVGTPVFYPSVMEPTGVVVLVRGGRVVLVAKDGSLVWAHDLGEDAQASPAVGDLDGDGVPEIVTATIPGAVVALGSDGVERWRFTLAGKVQEWSSPCLPDLDGDGRCEVVIGDWAGWMNCLSGDGARLWRISVDPHNVSSAAVVEGPGRGQSTIIFGTENDHIAAVSGSGELVWLTREESQFGRTNPTAGDLDGDGDYEVVINTSYNNPRSRLLALSARDGRVVWQARLNLHGYVCSAIADVDGDGANEVLVALRSNTIYCFEGNGTERWHTVTGGQAYFWSPAVADINEDGRCEIVAGVRDANERGKSWFVLNDQGEVLAEYEMPGGANAAPLVGDIDRDGRVDIILPGSKAGLLRCMTFGGKAKGARMPWVSHRFDAPRLGCVPANFRSEEKHATTSPVRLDAKWAAPVTWGENQLEVAWPDNTVPRVVVEASTVDPLGRRTTRVYDVSPGDLPSPIMVDLAGQGRYRVTVRLFDPNDWQGPAYAWDSTVKLGPFRSFADRARTELNGIAEGAADLAGTSPDASRLLRERFRQRLGTLDALQERAESVAFADTSAVDALLGAIREYRAVVAEDFALARTAKATAEVGAGLALAVWENPNPWDETPPQLEGVSPSAEVRIDVPLYRGEYESRAVTLVNLSSDPATVQLRPEQKVRDVVQAYEVVNTPRSDGTWVPDALAKLNPAGALRCGPGEARQLWLTVNGKALDPGDTDLRFELLRLGVDEPRVGLILQAHVSALDLRTAPVFRVCNWSSPARVRSDGVDLEAIDAAIEHGMNVFTMGMPARRCDTQGNLQGKVDWTEFDADLARMGPEGFVLLSGDGVRPPDGVERYGAVHVKAQRAWLHELANHLARRGWGRDRWALYPVDEPGLFGGTRIEIFKEVARHFRAAMPDAPIYANPAGFVTTENMAQMVPLVDVWCPEQALLRRQPELAPFFLNTGKPVWCYEAPGDVKTLRPLGYYRANAWMAFRLGLSGTGFWTQFYVGPTTRANDLWLRQSDTEYGATYIASGVEVISRRWEAFRDGIEDVRAFMLLREAAERARLNGRHPEAVARAQDLLGPKIERATQKPWECGDITRFLRDYEMDYGEIQRIRKEAAELTVLLREPDKGQGTG